MSKVLDASCSASSVVTVEGKTIQATILSEGKKASTGVVILEDDKATYFTANATDIKDVITQLKSCIDKIADTLTDIAAGMTGITTAPPATIAASVTTIKGYATQLNTIKGALK